MTPSVPRSQKSMPLAPAPPSRPSCTPRAAPAAVSAGAPFECRAGCRTSTRDAARRDQTCPLSTEGGTRHVQFVRGGGTRETHARRGAGAAAAPRGRGCAGLQGAHGGPACRAHMKSYCQWPVHATTESAGSTHVPPGPARSTSGPTKRIAEEASAVPPTSGARSSTVTSNLPAGPRRSAAAAAAARGIKGRGGGARSAPLCAGEEVAECGSADPGADDHDAPPAGRARICMQRGGDGTSNLAMPPF